MVGCLPVRMHLTRHRRRLALACVLAALVPFGVTAQEPQTGSPEQLFEQGLIALHHFEYDDAGEAFGSARAAAPSFVLAYWGEALTHYQALWRTEDPAAARRLLSRLGPDRAARAAKAATPRERDLLDSIEVLFGDGDPARRHAAYLDRMATLTARYPSDPDIASFY